MGAHSMYGPPDDAGTLKSRLLHYDDSHLFVGTRDHDGGTS